MGELEAVELRCAAAIGAERLEQTKDTLVDYISLLEGELASLPKGAREG